MSQYNYKARSKNRVGCIAQEFEDIFKERNIKKRPVSF
ncbi:hypothetical protein ACFL54_06870 [Planctomycetota bacterium]